MIDFSEWKPTVALLILITSQVNSMYGMYGMYG